MTADQSSALDAHEGEMPLSVPSSTASGSPVIPLSEEARKAYKHLYDTMETAIEGTTDAAVLEALNARQAEVDDVLTKDAIYRLQANTTQFEALQKQINETNAGLKTLEEQIESIAETFNGAGAILGAINNVLSLVPGA